MTERISARQVFSKAVQAGCSDVHIKPGVPPKMRAKNNNLIVVPGYEKVILTPEDTKNLIHETMESDPGAFARYSAPEVSDVDYAYDLFGVGRFRMQAFRTRGSDACVGRLLQDKPKTLSELNTPPLVKTLVGNKRGLILVTGATGSGKSTTMAAMVQYLNETQLLNIISIEDPIETIHTDALSSIVQRQIGSDVADFDSALVSALRLDPNVILIGEIRTYKTLTTALTAADTGHLVIATLHTEDATKAIGRMSLLFPPDSKELTLQSLASSLRGIISQRLVPDTKKGRVAIHEILLNTPEMAEGIVNGATEAELRTILENDPKMVSFRESFTQKFDEGVITLETAKSESNMPEYFDEYVKKIPVKEPQPILGVHPPKPGTVLPSLPNAPKTSPIINTPNTLPTLTPYQTRKPPRKRNNPLG